VSETGPGEVTADDQAACSPHRWSSQRNLLGDVATGGDVEDFVELIDGHARVVLEARR
jgi:hypothetical protein